ncbi:MAG: competence protein F [uncultured bacterium]|nr:MAG: competence protein F [uncultured bacterium]
MRLVCHLQKSCMDLLFPPVCGVCGVRLAVGRMEKMCDDCMRRIRFLRHPLCPVCGMELPDREGGGHLCGECLRRLPPYSSARSLVIYETAVRQLIHKLKYGGDTSVTGALLDLIGGYDLSSFADCEWIVPVPLHLARLRTRGLNQAAVLARLFFPERERAIRPDGLIRPRSTVAQTALRGIDRRKNLKNAFQPGAGFDPKNAIVCLVDDVFTTGTTVSECSRVLRHHGASEVKVLTLARAGIAGGGRHG